MNDKPDPGRMFQIGKDSVWWISYWNRGTRMRETTESHDWHIALDLLERRLALAAATITEDNAGEIIEAFTLGYAYKHPKPQQGWVYLVSDGTFLKIGFTTTSIKQRLRELQKQYSGDVVLLASSSTPDARGAESLLHEEFASYRVFGEWFLDDKVIREGFPGHAPVIP